MRWVSRSHKTNVHSLPTPGGSRTLSLKWHLLLLVVGSLLPVVLFAVAVVHRLSIQEQAASERRALLAARNLSETVEREISGTVRTLQALASSQQLNQGDLKSFHSEAKRVAQTQATWVSVILLSPDGRQLVNTRQPFGKRLPSVIEPASLQRIVETRQPTVGNLARGKLEPSIVAIPVRIPVMRDNNVQYILTAIITQNALAKVVDEQTTLDGEWTRTVVDAQGVVIARTRNPERFVGKRGTPSFLKRIGETTEGVYHDTTLEGVKVYVAFRRMKGSPWTVAVTVPVKVIQGPAQRAMWLVIGSGLALLLVSGIGALLLSRRISHSITSVALAAEALAKGERPQIPPSFITEVVALGESLESSANLLSQRERERTENLARAEMAREQAEAANRIKDEFLAVLSHELRSPLNPILGWSKLLRTGRLDATKTAHALETIERNAKLQTQLIEDLLDVSRILQGKLGLNMASVNLAVTIEAALETVRLAAQAKSIQIQLRLDPTTGQVLGDSARLQQVIWNLLSNAVKFTPEGGQVDIRVEHSSSHAQIQVSDTGKGIPPDFLPHVFEYFRQADSTTTRKFGGLGLGLAIARHLVELHGGTVWAESPGEGLGATFTVRLPLMPLPTSTPQDSLPATPVSHLSGLRILVVDDEPDIRDIVALILEQAGATVSMAASAPEALNLMEQCLPDVLICDIGMPDMDGYMLMRQIRTVLLEQGEKIPASSAAIPKALRHEVQAIALTAYAGEVNQQQALAAGFQQHLAKPVEPEELVRAIAALVNR
jgi:signal transduction histidine kinase/ActR/RegA family two-component response regulator